MSSHDIALPRLYEPGLRKGQRPPRMSSDADVFHSEVSWMIIDFLAGREATEAEMEEKLKVPSGKLRAGLDHLIAARLVSRRAGSTDEEAGSEYIYSLSGPKAKSIFPPRDYMFLSESIFRGIVRSLGPDSAKLVLHDIGLRAGEDMAQDLLLKSGRSYLDPDAFVELFVNGALNAAGAYPRLILKTSNSVEFEQFNCPFQDLADRYPGLMCDTMDEGVHEGMDRKLSLRTERINCKGHQDPSCRFKVNWAPPQT